MVSDGLRISEAARLVGITATTLRAWEQRYGVVTPSRSAQSGYRQYTLDDVDRLRHMRVLVGSGIAPRRAAAIVKDVDRGQARRRRAASESNDVLDDHSSLTRAGRYFDAEQVRELLDHAFSVDEPDVVIERWLMPSMRDVGQAWEEGELDVVAEHFVAAAVMRKLGALFDGTPAPGRGRRVVVGLPPGALHELPALAFSVCLRRRGLDVLYAGAAIPLDSWRRLVSDGSPHTVVLAVSMRDDAAEAEAVAGLLTSAGVDSVFAGGVGASDVPSAIPLPSSLSLAAEVVAEAAL